MAEPDRSAAKSSRTGSAAARADLISFNGHLYRGISLRTHPPYDRMGSIPASHLQEIGTAVRPGGNYGAAVIPPRSVQVASIDGMSPEIAIAGLPRGNVYLREGAEVPRVLATAPWVEWTVSG